jgi:hypothetical protein
MGVGNSWLWFAALAGFIAIFLFVYRSNRRLLSQQERQAVDGAIGAAMRKELRSLWFILAATALVAAIDYYLFKDQGIILRLFILVGLGQGFVRNLLIYRRLQTNKSFQIREALLAGASIAVMAFLFYGTWSK